MTRQWSEMMCKTGGDLYDDWVALQKFDYEGLLPETIAAHKAYWEHRHNCPDCTKPVKYDK